MFAVPTQAAAATAAERHEALLQQAQALFAGERDRTANAANLAALLNQGSPTTKELWLEIGINDANSGHSASDFGAAQLAEIDAVVALVPDVKIYVAGLARASSTEDPTVPSIYTDYRAVASANAAARPANCVYVDMSALPSPGNFNGGPHPNTAGHLQEYTAIKAALGY